MSKLFRLIYCSLPLLLKLEWLTDGFNQPAYIGRLKPAANQKAENDDAANRNQGY
jgi:hypothetical protein